MGSVISEDPKLKDASPAPKDGASDGVPEDVPAEAAEAREAASGVGSAIEEARERSLEALAEDVSGEQLDGFFEVWLDTAERPAKSVANGLQTCV